MHGEVVGPPLGPKPRDAVEEVMREDRQDRGSTYIRPGVGGEPRAARAVEAEVGGEGRNEVKTDLPGHIKAQGRDHEGRQYIVTSPRRPL